MSVNETSDFLSENKLTVDLAFQYNFLDFQDPVQAFKGTATFVKLENRFDGDIGMKAYLSLVLGEADIVDELINPITPPENQIKFFNTERTTAVDKTVYNQRSIESFLDDEKNSPDESWGNLFPLEIQMELSGLT